MKKLILTFLLGVPLYCLAQQDSVHYKGKAQFCMMHISTRTLSSKINIVADTGQVTGLLSDKRLRDDHGKLLEFNSEIDAVNYLTTQGWELVNTVAVHGDDSPRYLFRRKTN